MISNLCASPCLDPGLMGTNWFIFCDKLEHFIVNYGLVVLIAQHKQAATKLDNSFLLAVCLFFNKLLFSTWWEIFDAQCMISQKSVVL